MESENREAPRRGTGWGGIALLFLIGMLILNNLGWQQGTVTGKVEQGQIVSGSGQVYRIVGGGKGDELVKEHKGATMAVFGKIKEAGGTRVIQVLSYAAADQNTAKG